MLKADVFHRALKTTTFSALKKSGSIEALRRLGRQVGLGYLFSALKKSGSIEARPAVCRRASTAAFSALKKSGSIEAQRSPGEAFPNGPDFPL